MTPALRVDDPTPAARRDRIAALAARDCPGAGTPTLDAEPFDFLGGPWESAIWTRDGRRVRVTCFPAATLIHRDAPGVDATEVYRRPCDGRVLAALAWLTGA